MRVDEEVARDLRELEKALWNGKKMGEFAMALALDGFASRLEGKPRFDWEHARFDLKEALWVSWQEWEWLEGVLNRMGADFVSATLVDPERGDLEARPEREADGSTTVRLFRHDPRKGDGM